MADGEAHDVVASLDEDRVAESLQVEGEDLPLERAGHPCPHEKLRQLDDLGARIYAAGGSMEHFHVAGDQFVLPGIHIATYPSFRTYGHLARGSEEHMRDRLAAYANRLGQERATAEDER